MILKKISLSLLASLLIANVFAQDEDIFGISDKAKAPKSESGFGNAARNFMEMFTLELSGGAAFHQTGMDFFSTSLDRYPLSQFQNLDTPLAIDAEHPLTMNSSGWAYPINAGLRLNLFNLLTIGGGYGMEWGKVAPLRGGDFDFVFDGSAYQVSKLYGTVGLVLYDAKRRQSFLRWRYRHYSSSNHYMQSELRQRARQNYPWRFILEGEFGQLDMKKAYDSRLAVADEPYYGIGLRIERDFSEYAKFFVKGGAEFRKFTYSNVELEEFQHIDQQVYAVQVGLAMTLPGTKRCKIRGCGVVMKHIHDGIEYRGSSIFNFQNRKIGQWY